MKAGYYVAVMPSSRYLADETPLDRARQAGKISLVSVSAGGFAAETMWVKIRVPKDFGGPVEFDLVTWSRWKPADLGALPPSSMRDFQDPVVVRAHDAAKGALEKLDFGLSGIGLLALLYLLAKR
jgi:hypothetical protein